jgi:hypothetical protein
VLFFLVGFITLWVIQGFIWKVASHLLIRLRLSTSIKHLELEATRVTGHKPTRIMFWNMTCFGNRRSINLPLLGHSRSCIRVKSYTTFMFCLHLYLDSAKDLLNISYLGVFIYISFSPNDSLRKEVTVIQNSARGK